MIKFLVPLAALAVIGNLANLTLFNSISFLFGSIFGIMALRLLGLGWGVLIAAIGASVTIFLWGHAYAAAIFTLEVLFVGVVARRTDHLALVDALFWVAIGFWLVLLTYAGGLGLSSATAAYVGLKQGLNGIFNAVMAGLALTALRALLPAACARMPAVSIVPLLFHMVAFVTILSAAALVVAESRWQYSQIQDRMSVVMGTVGTWAAAQVARAPAPEDLRDAFLQELGALMTYRDGMFDPGADIAVTTLDGAGQTRDILGQSVSFREGGQFVMREQDLDRWEPVGTMAELQRARASRYVLDVPVAGVDNVQSLRVELAAGPVIDILEAAGRRNLVFLSATATFGLALSYWLIAWLTAPLSRLATVSSGMSDAILSKRPPGDFAPSAVVEFDTLGSTLGRMARSLSKAFAEVEDLTHSLEERVRDRTAQLDLMSQVARQTDTVVVVTDRLGRVTWVNESFERFTGYSSDEVAGKIPGQLLQRTPPPPELVEHMRTSIARGEGFHVEVLNQAKDGRSYWIEIRCTPLHDADGALTGFIALQADVSERRAARQELEFSLERLNLATEVGQLGIWGFDARTGAIDWNDRNYDLHGIDRAASVDLEAEWSAVVDPADAATIRDMFTVDLSRQSESFVLEYRISHPKKGTRVLNTLARCMFEGDRVAHVIGITRDVTDERRASEDLRRTAQHTQAILNNVMDAIIAIDSEGRITSYNRAAERIFGYAPDEIIGKDVSVLMTADHATRHGGFILGYLGSGKRKVMGRISEFTAQRRDGEAFPIELAVSEIVDGNKRFFIGIIRDVTERMQLEARLRQAQKLEAVGQLTGGIAHDFNNLLTVILGNSEILVDALDGRDDLKGLADMIATTAERGAELTSRLLAFARRQPLQPQQVDINTLIVDMEPLLRRAIGGNVAVTVRPADNLWQAEVDVSQLEAAVLNLALNARDAMPDGGTLTIETANVVLEGNIPTVTEAPLPGEYVVLKVSDTGTGMPREVLERAFEPFFTTKDVGKGSGLGLSMVFGFVKQSGGHTALVSEQGQGTQVMLHFPRSQAAGDSAPDSPPGAAALQRGAETVLVVEDDALVRSHVAGLIGSLGYHVVEAQDGASAIAVLVERSDIDLLFTDVIMPGGMTGKDVADEARRLHPSIKVLFTTGYTESSIVHDGRLNRNVELLGKPYRRAALATKLREILSRS